MYDTSDFRKALKIELDGKPYIIVDFQHVKPGKGGAFVRTKLKSLLDGSVIERTFRSGEKLGRPQLEDKQMQYLYREEDRYCFMDTETYEQHYIDREHLGESVDFLRENVVITVVFYQDRPIGVELPNFVTLEVVHTDPGVKGDTATGGSKPAELDSGATINVPLFINIGDKLKIDTRTGQYVERVK